MFFSQKKNLSTFLINYKFSTIKRQKLFYTPAFSFLFPIIEMFKSLGYIYCYTLSKCKSRFKIYPRYNKRFSNFQISMKNSNSLLQRKDIIRIKNSGYQFILFSPFQFTNSKSFKFLSSFDLNYLNIPPGYLIIRW
jgi:hypothetical protein